MTWLIMGTILLGIIAGKIGILAYWLPYLDNISSLALAILLFGVGIELGRNKEIWQRLWQTGWKIVLVPAAVIAGTLIGSAIIGLLLEMPMNESTAVGAGFGWYSLSAGLIAKIYNVELGTIAFLANVFRELIAVMTIPFLARYFGGYLPIGPGGATTMDTTLPIINRMCGQEVALVAFISGAILSILVPVLVPLLIGMR